MTSAIPTAESQHQDPDKKKKRKKRFFFFFLLAGIGIGLLLYFFRDQIPMLGHKKEGVVEYDVTYPDIEEGNMMAAGLPDEAKYYFKGNKTITSLSGMMGMIEIGFITDEETKTAKQSLVVFTNKYVAELNEGGVNKMNAGFVKEIQLVEGETKKIADLKCNKAKAILENGKEIDIWYTTEIGNPGVNWSNPYSQIKGVLMEFEIEKYGIAMKLVAKKVLKDPVPDEQFSVPGDYKKMPIEELENIMKTLNPVK
ncbi:MAG: hypothetical protein IT233_12510 [Bacteroidia bacterium]|nr:hypothetical protein [Bacteroidia bacterium]